VQSDSSKMVPIAQQNISTDTIGQLVMVERKQMDPISYWRFASTYPDFLEASEFGQECVKWDISGWEIKDAVPPRDYGAFHKLLKFSLIGHEGSLSRRALIKSNRAVICRIGTCCQPINAGTKPDIVRQRVVKMSIANISIVTGWSCIISVLASRTTRFAIEWSLQTFTNRFN
jgi:hypothetical protein